MSRFCGRPRAWPRLYFGAGLCATLIIILGRASFASPSPDSLDGIWDEAISAYQQGDYQKAATNFTNWNAKAHESGIESAEAHYDLGLSLWQLKQPDGAIFQILKSTRLRVAPWRIWADLVTLSDLQKRIGVRESLADAWFFRSALVFNPSLLFLFGTTAFWLLCAFLFLRCSRPLKYVAARRTLLVLAVGLGLITSVAVFNERYYCRFGVLMGPAAAIPIYKIPELKSEQQLAEFPSGTLVNVLETREQVVSIDAPVAGWIETSHLERLTP